MLWVAAALPALGQIGPITLSATFTNPAPAGQRGFGVPLAAMGPDRVLVGWPGASHGVSESGEAYLFRTNGTLLTTFTNPTPDFQELFGSALAVVSNRIVIGASRDNSGRAYLFSTNGVLINSFTNPTGANFEGFGSALAAVGTGRVLIGASGASIGAPGAGAAYLFNVNGGLLATFANPAPGLGDSFGSRVTAVGNHVLIAAHYDGLAASSGGAAYLFNTNGALITVFTNPAPEASDLFGYAVAALGPDKVIIGSLYDDSAGLDAGTAFLFSTNGALIAQFPNPNPAPQDLFGASVTAVGLDKVLIGCPSDDIGTNQTGAAYLFATNGTLLAALLNSPPRVGENFGAAVAELPGERVLISAPETTNGGTVYLFDLGPNYIARLSIQLVSGGDVRVSWPRPGIDWLLDETFVLETVPGTTLWTQVPFPYDTNATEISVTTTPQGNRFYRLRHP